MPHREKPTSRYFPMERSLGYQEDGCCLRYMLVVVGVEVEGSGQRRWRSSWLYFPWLLLWGAQVNRLSVYEFWADGKIQCTIVVH